MKKMNILLSLSALVFTLLVYSGCYGPSCEGIDTEPLIWITFEQGTDHTSVYGVKDKIEARPISNNNVEMPLSLKRTRTTFCFLAPGRTDTLTLEYTREAIAESLECGVLVHMSDVSVAEPTTFDRVYVTGYTITIYND